jgi:hypothetical protein
MFHPSGLDIQVKLDSLALKDFLKFKSNFRILARNDLRLIVQDRDATPESAEHLPEFEANVPAAENNQMLGQFL